MIYPEVDPKVWSERYGIDLKERECVCCKKNFLSNIAVAIKGYRGFQIPPHGCGAEYLRTTLVPYGKSEKEKWLLALFG